MMGLAAAMAWQQSTLAGSQSYHCSLFTIVNQVDSLRKTRQDQDHKHHEQGRTGQQ
jgi:hypothetical protein